MPPMVAVPRVVAQPMPLVRTVGVRDNPSGRGAVVGRGGRCFSHGCDFCVRPGMMFALPPREVCRGVDARELPQSPCSLGRMKPMPARLDGRAEAAP